jgi:hypothetical protein
VAPIDLSARNARISGQPATAGRGSAHTIKASKIPRINVVLLVIETSSSDKLFCWDDNGESQRPLRQKSWIAPLDAALGGTGRAKIYAPEHRLSSKIAQLGF